MRRLEIMCLTDACRYNWLVSCMCMMFACAHDVVPAIDAGDGDSDAAVFDAGAQPPLAPKTPDPGSAQPSSATPLPPPADFVQTEIGGYKLGAALEPGATDLQLNIEHTDPARCSTMIAIVRDFRGARESNPHPDFEVFDGKKPTLGLVGAALGSDRKPVYTSQCEAMFDKRVCPDGQMTSSEAAFAAWYRSMAGVNSAFLAYLAFEPNGGVYTFESQSFFPLDGQGFGNAGGKKKHNFGFTTELHSTFVYRGGEVFAFTGDDDLWVFINGRLAIDLGGLHPPASAEIELDAARDSLGIEPGREYGLDLFHAERHSASSNFRVDTNLEFSQCGRVTVELL